MSRYSPDVVYNRGALHEDAKQRGLRPGNNTAGITAVGGELCIFWNPFLKLYANRWIIEPQEFIYSGEGSLGPMEDSWGNRQLKGAEAEGAPVTVFYKIRRAGSDWLCLGTFAVLDSEPGVSRDSAGRLRADVRFHLRRNEAAPIHEQLPVLGTATPPPPPSEEELWVLVEAQTDRGGAIEAQDANYPKQA